MNLDNTKKLYEHINILYFRQSNQRSNLELSKFSVVPPDGYEAYASGFNLMTIEDELGSWSAEDQAAFVRFLDTKRVSKFLESLIEEIDEPRTELTNSPLTIPGVRALWWKRGIHLLQQEQIESEQSAQLRAGCAAADRVPAARSPGR